MASGSSAPAPSGHIGAQRAAQLDRAGTALFERRVVEVGIGIGVENLVREGRGFGGVDGDGADAAIPSIAGGALRENCL